MAWLGSLSAHNGGERKRRDRTGVDRNGLDWFFTAHKGLDLSAGDGPGVERTGLVLDLHTVEGRGRDRKG